MPSPPRPRPEETLDPQDWEPLRALGHRMVDDMIEHMRTFRERPGWQPIPEETRERFRQPVPVDPQPTEQVYEEFVRHVLPYPTGCTHPRFWGWVMGTGTATGAFGDFLAAVLNSNTGGGHHAANYVEHQVVNWCKEMLGYPATASGLLTGGGSAANLIGLAVARNAQAGYDLRTEGVHAEGGRMMVYASADIHSSVQKSLELLGLGSKSLHMVPVDRDLRIDVEALRSAVAEDRAAGLRPIAVVGAAGATDTGACDDLNAVADLCRDENLWLHVDGAFGAWAALAPQSRHLVAGMERADSLAVDLHKWMYIPLEIGCVMVRDEELHRRAFSLTPAYLAHGAGDRGLAGGDLPWFSDYGFQLSRGFRALKAWMSIKEHGAHRFGRVIQRNIDDAQYVAELVRRQPELELSFEPMLNVVCFRYVGVGTGGAEAGGATTTGAVAPGTARPAGRLDDPTLDRLNKQIEVELQERGIAYPSTSVIGGRTVIHVANTNHRSRRADFDLLVREVVRLGGELLQYQ